MKGLKNLVADLEKQSLMGKSYQKKGVFCLHVWRFIDSGNNSI